MRLFDFILRHAYAIDDEAGENQQRQQNPKRPGRKPVEKSEAVRYKFSHRVIVIPFFLIKQMRTTGTIV